MYGMVFNLLYGGNITLNFIAGGFVCLFVSKSFLATTAELFLCDFPNAPNETIKSSVFWVSLLKHTPVSYHLKQTESISFENLPSPAISKSETVF